MNKDTELARMEHKMNTYWAKIENDFLCDEDGFDDFIASVETAKDLFDLVGCPSNDPLRRIIQWAGLKMVKEARERDIIPEQRGVQ